MPGFRYANRFAVALSSQIIKVLRQRALLTVMLRHFCHSFHELCKWQCLEVIFEWRENCFGLWIGEGLILLGAQEVLPYIKGSFHLSRGCKSAKPCFLFQVSAIPRDLLRYSDFARVLIGFGAPFSFSSYAFLRQPLQRHADLLDCNVIYTSSIYSTM
jgi:hypothetical protein